MLNLHGRAVGSLDLNSIVTDSNPGVGNFVKCFYGTNKIFTKMRQLFCTTSGRYARYSSGEILPNQPFRVG